MPKEYSRSERLGALIQHELAVLIQKEVKDPRLVGMITVNSVAVTRDFAYAKVYITVFTTEITEKIIAANIKVLNNAAGFLRTQLAKRIKARKIPELTFIYDKTIIEGNRLAKLIDEAVSEDRVQKTEDE